VDFVVVVIAVIYSIHHVYLYSVTHQLNSRPYIGINKILNHVDSWQ
jgi:hypothetical protein